MRFQQLALLAIPQTSPVLGSSASNALASASHRRPLGGSLPRIMRLLVFCASVVTATMVSGAAHARDSLYYLISDEKNKSDWVDLLSIHSVGEYKRYWATTIFDDPQDTFSKGPYVFLSTLIEEDCIQRRSHIISISARAADGSAVFSEPYAGEWTFSEPGTIGAEQMQAVCEESASEHAAAISVDLVHLREVVMSRHAKS